MTQTPIPNYADDDLGDFLAGPEPNWGEEPEAPPDAYRANAMLRRLAGLYADAHRDQEIAAAQVAQVNEWLSRREQAAARKIAWLELALERYHRAVLEVRPTALTIALPAGTLKSRMGQPAWEVDVATTLGFLIPEPLAQSLAATRMEYMAAVTTALTEGGQDSTRVAALTIAPPPEVTVSLKGLKAWATRRDDRGEAVAFGVAPTGEPVPGVTVTPGERRFSIDLLGEQDHHHPDEETLR